MSVFSGSGISLSRLTTLRDAYLDAIEKVALNQSYSLNGRSITRADLGQLRETLGELNAAIDELNDDAPTTTKVSFTGL